ncbi:hypothetical protein DNFV4_02407 [Nitrospira tepida]|uniref:Lipoprotein n=1 Tax=Nitrospira tepida TaxID=2973512 RepID=A0AA86TCA9_9BACT|nr:DUF6279 family lipoprotein [Nitrospira tepida]CAI4031984.1 hypothetical protein DNFV4_02407 [Nitrospira tepida]
MGFRYLKRWIVACVVAVTAGCAAIPFAYRHADSLIAWQADHYFNLTSEQRSELITRLKSVLSRHRREALPEYERFLAEVRSRVERGLTGDDIDWFYEVLERMRADLMERVVADGSPLLVSMAPSQVGHLESVLLRENEKAARLAEGPVEDRIRKRGEQTVELVQDWTGSLSKEQRSQIRAWSRVLPDSEPLWFRYRKEQQQRWLALLRRPLTSATATGEWREVLIHQLHTAPAWYRDAVLDWRAGVKTLALRIDRILTPRQRDHVSHRLQELIEQIRALETETHS